MERKLHKISILKLINAYKKEKLMKKSLNYFACSCVKSNAVTIRLNIYIQILGFYFQYVISLLNNVHFTTSILISIVYTFNLYTIV